jgi:ribonuclease HI
VTPARSDDALTTAYTDGACSGNPGPGGWAWAIPGGAWATGYEAESTNQRMEVAAVLDAVRSLDGRLHVVSDSTYVVDCFKKRWYVNWLKDDRWLNSKKQPVKNRDLWEPLIQLYLERGGPAGDVTFEWVKGHSGDVMNDLVDQLAVGAWQRKSGRRGDTPPGPDDLGPPDVPCVLGAPPASGSARPSGAKAADGRVPEGHRLVVLGHRPPELGGYDPNPVDDAVRRKLAEIFAAKADLHDDLVVLTGLRLGTETLAAEAAAEAGVPYVAILPYPDPDSVWPAASRRRFKELVAGARSAVTLERKVPADKAQAGQAMTRRDAWLARNASEAVLVRRPEDNSLNRLARSLEDHLGDDVWVIDPG